MAEADYLLAALPDRHIVLGQLLRPFALGHMMILRRMGNAFALNQPASLEDLLRGVFICAQTVDDALESLQDPKLPETIAQWGETLVEFNLLEKIGAFTDYIQKGSTFPELCEPDGEFRMPGAPFLQRIKLVLQSEFGCSQSEALNYPFGSAMHDYFGFFEMKSRIRILSDEDKEIAAEHEQMMRDLGPLMEKLEKEANSGN